MRGMMVLCVTPITVRFRQQKSAMIVVFQYSHFSVAGCGKFLVDAFRARQRSCNNPFTIRLS